MTHYDYSLAGSWWTPKSGVTDEGRLNVQVRAVVGGSNPVEVDVGPQWGGELVFMGNQTFIAESTPLNGTYQNLDNTRRRMPLTELQATYNPTPIDAPQNGYDV